MGRVAGVALAIAQHVGVECLRCRVGKIACTFEQRYAVSWRFCPRGRPTLVGTAREIGTTLKIGQARLCPPFECCKEAETRTTRVLPDPDNSCASDSATCGRSTL